MVTDHNMLKAGAVHRANVRHLMLKREVIDAVMEGRFNIWAVETIDQGIELLTGAPAGDEQPDGTYPEGTAHYLVSERLTELAEAAKEFGPMPGLGAATPDGEPAAQIESKTKGPEQV